MQYSQRSKSFITKFALVVLAVSTLSSCVDKIPGALRETGHQAERAVWEYKAKDGDIEAQYDAAELNCCGKRPLRDDINALNLYCEAALDGNPASQVEVGKFYAHDNPKMRKIGLIPYDPAIAYAMYGQAADAGNTEAAGRKAALLQRIKTADIDRARELRKDFKNIPCKLTR
jgi:TPR repeat protein